MNKCSIFNSMRIDCSENYTAKNMEKNLPFSPKIEDSSQHEQKRSSFNRRTVDIAF